MYRIIDKSAQESKMKVQENRLSFKHFLCINFGILLVASGIYFFKAPNGFATGGVSGIAIILASLKFSRDLKITQSIYMLIINIILLIVGAIILGKKCGIRTFYCSIMLSLENMAFEYFLPIEKITGMSTLTNQPILELVYAILLTGIGSAVLFRYKASSGGTDIVALILKKYTNLNVGSALLFTDFLIAASTFIVYNNVTIGLYALLGLFAKVFIIDDILDSLNMYKSFTIITSNPEEIQKFIINGLHHSATVYNGKGIYTNSDKYIIVTVCKRSEALRLRAKVKEVDPGSFVIITKTSEIAGKGFRDVQ